jgi:hypothetical protein
MFRSHDLFRVFLLYRPVVEFQCRSALLSSTAALRLAREQRFHLLGLSLQQVRLLHCTQYCAEEETMPFTVPRNMREWIHIRQPEYVLQNRSAAGPGVESMKGVSFGTKPITSARMNAVSHFLKAVDGELNTMLRNDTAKLVLAGVEKKLHRRAMDLLVHSPSELLQKALTNFGRHGVDSRIPSNPDHVINAAREG